MLDSYYWRVGVMNRALQGSPWLDGSPHVATSQWLERERRVKAICLKLKESRGITYQSMEAAVHRLGKGSVGKYDRKMREDRASDRLCAIASNTAHARKRCGEDMNDLAVYVTEYLYVAARRLGKAKRNG